MEITFRQFGISIVKTFLLLLLCAWSMHASALSNVTILTTNHSPAVKRFVSELETRLKKQRDLTVSQTESNSGISINIPKNTLVIAVGTQALRYASNLSDATPVIGVLVPKVNYETILADSRRDPHYFSAIYLDQPFTRQFALIKTIFSDISKVGVLLGPISQFQSNDLQKAANQFNIETDIKLVNKADELQSNLEALMKNKKTLLAIPDPLIYSRETAQTILLTSYRHHSPVIGFSQSYVKSGAIAAVYTSPEQFASDVADTLAQLPKAKFQLPEARPPKQFSIKVNYQVARSLGVAIPNEDMLYLNMQRLLK